MKIYLRHWINWLRSVLLAYYNLALVVCLWCHGLILNNLIVQIDNTIIIADHIILNHDVVGILLVLVHIKMKESHNLWSFVLDPLISLIFDYLVAKWFSFCFFSYDFRFSISLTHFNRIAFILIRYCLYVYSHVLGNAHS